MRKFLALLVQCGSRCIRPQVVKVVNRSAAVLNIIRAFHIYGRMSTVVVNSSWSQITIGVLFSHRYYRRHFNAILSTHNFLIININYELFSGTNTRIKVKGIRSFCSLFFFLEINLIVISILDRYMRVFKLKIF